MPTLTTTDITQKNTTNVFKKIRTWLKDNQPRIRIKIKTACKKLWKLLFFCIKVLSKALAGAVIFAFMAELAPELREQLPNFYQFIDLVLDGLELISAKAMEYIQQFL